MRLFYCLGLLLLVGRRPALAERSPTTPEPAQDVPDLARLLPRIAALPDSGRPYQLLAIADQQTEAGRFEEATAALREAASAAQASSKARFVGRVELGQGYPAVHLADFAEALRHCQRAPDLAKTAHDYRQQIRVLTKIAGLSYQTHGWRQAKQAQQGLHVAQAHRLPQVEAEGCGKLSNLAGMQNQPDKTLVYNKKTLAMHLADPATLAYLTSPLNQGLGYKNLGQYAQAAQRFRQVLAYAQQKRDSLLLG